MEERRLRTLLPTDQLRPGMYVNEGKRSEKGANAGEERRGAEAVQGGSMRSTTFSSFRSAASRTMEGVKL
eukprot:450684-Hanusia_phi.AAC.1